MKDRSATNTLRGYFYQFDYSIIQLLELKNGTDSITVEGVEDIDISTATDQTAIQCKYYSKTEYNHSVIAKPIRLMLDHFAGYKKGRNNRVKYILRGHFKYGQHKLSLPIDVIALKSFFLTYTKTVNGVRQKFKLHEKLNLDDNELLEFLSLLTVDINADDFVNQYNDLIRLLRAKFNCSEFAAENFYYNGSLKIIRELSIQKTIGSRKISKNNFLKKIDTRQILFNEWFIEKKGEKAYFQGLRKEYFSSLNISPFERIFIFEIDPKHYQRNELKELLFIISRKWSKITQRDPKPFCPYVYIHNLESRELIELKKELKSEGFDFIDGYDFMGAEFNPNSIAREPNFTNGIRLKIINEIKFINEILKTTKATKEIYQFFIQKPFYENADISLKHIKIQVSNLNNIKNIL